MKLDLKKNLAAKTLGVGKNKVVFNTARLEEIKEAITRQDIKDLVKSGAITIKENSGRKTNVARKHRRRAGSIKKKVKNRKQEYVKMVRKLRKHLSELMKQGRLDKDQNRELRKQIRNRKFKSKRNLKEHLD
jgi:large subunit ribosomal protein L19e